MREIFRPETLWRDVLPLAIFAFVVLIVFLMAFFNPEDLPRAEAAVVWTMRAFGALVAAIATFGLFWRALHGDSLDLQFTFVLALLAGLLLVNVHWSLAIALGAIGIALIIREIWLGGSIGRRTSSDYVPPPADRPRP